MCPQAMAKEAMTSFCVALAYFMSMVQSKQHNIEICALRCFELSNSNKGNFWINFLKIYSNSIPFQIIKFETIRLFKLYNSEYSFNASKNLIQKITRKKKSETL